MNGTRFSRAEATVALSAFLKHVEEINADDNSTFYIKNLVGYGSYFRNEQDRVGDVDLGVEVAFRPEAISKQKALALFVEGLGGTVSWTLPSFRQINTNPDIISLVSAELLRKRYDNVPLITNGIFLHREPRVLPRCVCGHPEEFHRGFEAFGCRLCTCHGYVDELFGYERRYKVS